MKIGAELEMVLIDFTNKDDRDYICSLSDLPNESDGGGKYLNKFIRIVESLDGWEIDDDGSVDYENEYGEIDFQYIYTTEIKTSIYASTASFIKALKKLFDHDWIAINTKPVKGKLTILFNESTGTHIHYSSKYVKRDQFFYCDSYTKELDYLDNWTAVRLMADYIESKCKYKGPKKDLFRDEYASYRWEHGDKYVCINTSNNSDLGTIEFRLFNLHKVKKRDLFNVFKHFIELMTESILYAGRKLIISKFDEIQDDLTSIIEHHNYLIDDYSKQKILRAKTKLLVQKL